MITRACDLCKKLLEYDQHARIVILVATGKDSIGAKPIEKDSIDVCDGCLEDERRVKELIEKIRYARTVRL